MLELHYAVGDEVRLFMKDGEVDRMEVDNPIGTRLMPTCASAPEPGAPAPDTTEPGAAAPDTAGPPRPPGVDGQAPAVGGRPPPGNGGVR